MTLDATVAGASILVVDDEESNVALIEQILARAGYTNVTGLQDPRRVLPRFLDQRPDLVLLDLHMPHLDGFTVLERLRPHIPTDAYLPILVLTADITTEAKQRALVGGARDFVTKPFDRIDLLLRINNLLETRVLYRNLRQQHDALERLYEQARTALDLRDQVLATVTHDLGQPLTSIRVGAELMRRRAASAPAAAGWLTEELAAIDDATTTMWAMITELLDTARLEIGRPLSLNRQPTDLVALARHEVAAQRHLTHRHHLYVEAAMPDLIGAWDPFRLTRVIGNVLTNAVKYSPDGGEIGVTLTREPDGAGEWAVLRVADTGIGIPAADLPFVFDRFRRGGNLAGRIEGSGVGLWGARQIIEQHGGTITIDSREGDGTTVTVRLPLPESE